MITLAIILVIAYAAKRFWSKHSRRCKCGAKTCLCEINEALDSLREKQAAAFDQVRSPVDPEPGQKWVTLIGYDEEIMEVEVLSVSDWGVSYKVLASGECFTRSYRGFMKDYKPTK